MSENKIPEEVRKKIEEKFPTPNHGGPSIYSLEEKQEQCQQAAEFGYSLSLEEIEKWKRLYENAMKFKTKAEQSALKNHVAAETVESEKEMNAILSEEIERLKQTIVDLTQQGKEVSHKTIALMVENEKLKAENERLRARLEELEHGS